MKALIVLAGTTAGFFAVNNPIEISPDSHIIMWSDCSTAFNGEEASLFYFSRAKCEFSKSMPYDSVECFLSAWQIRRPDENETQEEKNQLGQS